MSRTDHRPAVTLPPVVLTPEEAAAVAVALAAQPDGPYAEHGRGALEKVLQALEPDADRRVHLLATSLWVDAEVGHAAGIRAVVEQAVTRRRVLVLHYRDGRGSASRREVEPQLLAKGGRHWFLVAWCRERDAIRWFREDRIDRVELTTETMPRREPLDVGGPPADGHPAGRALGRAVPAARPRLTVLPGGRP